MDAPLDVIDTDAPAAAEPEARVTIMGMEDEAFAKQVRVWLKESFGAKKDKLARRKRAHEIYAGKHWADDDKLKADTLKKPMLTLNMMLGIIGAIEGEERDGRKEIKFFGNDETDDGPAFSMNRLLKWVMKNCGGEFALSKMFHNATIGGQDWIGAEVDYFEDPDGKICLIQVDDEEIFEDPTDTTSTCSNSRFLLRVKMWAEDEIEAKWPGSLDKLRMEYHDCEPGMESDAKGFKDIYDAPGDVKSLKMYDSKEKRWAIIECWWQQVEPGCVVVNDQTGLLDEMTPEEFELIETERTQARQDALIKRVSMAGAPPVMDLATGMAMPPQMPEIPPMLQKIDRPIRRLYQAFQCVDHVLERTPCPMKRLKRFPYVPLRAYFNKVDNDYFGFIDPVIDVNLQHNVEQSVIVQLMQLMPKASWMAPKGAYHNRNEWMTKLAQPGALLEYAAQRGKPEQIQTPPLPRHLVDMAMLRPQQMRDISGVNQEQTGGKSGADTGVVIDKRQKAGRTLLTPFFDNYRETKIEVGKVLLSFIQHYVTPGRQLRIVGDAQKTEFVVMTEEMKLQRFDITADESDENVNDRFESLYVLQTTLPAMMKAGISLTPEFIDLLPLPPHIKKSWRRQIAWEMTLANRIPPPNWEEGMPIPLPPAAPALTPPPQ